MGAAKLGSAPKVVPPHSWKADAGCWWEASVHPHGGLCTVRLNVPATRRQFTREQSMREAKMEAALFLWLFLEGTHGLFPHYPNGHMGQP